MAAKVQDIFKYDTEKQNKSGKDFFLRGSHNLCLICGQTQTFKKKIKKKRGRIVNKKMLFLCDFLRWQMAINSIFSFLKPKNDKFFILINQVGETLVDTSSVLVDFVQCEDKEKMADLYHRIKAYETKSDHLTDNIFKELNETFITPFDREDIHELCEMMDDMLDGINSASKRVLLFQPKTIPDEIIEMCRMIQRGTVSVNAAVHELYNITKNPQVPLEQCNLLHDIEAEADELYENFIKGLFESVTDGIELVKLKEIMQDLERTTDIAKSIGKIIKMIIVKYA